MPSISRRAFAASVASSMALEAAQAARRPNIVFICSDQHSGRVLGVNGHPLVRTPNLDRLAAMGVNFRNAYCGSPVCAPGRASLMTGLYPSDVGSYCNSTPFDDRVPSWGARLKQSGYACWATGKLDLTKGKDFGFQEIDTEHEHSIGPDITSLFRAPVCFRPGERDNVNGQFKDREHPDHEVAARALDFLRNDGGGLSKPWVMYAGFRLPHPKFIAQAKYEAIYPPEKMPLPTIPPGYLERRHKVFQVLANFKNIATPIPEERIRRARAAYFGMISELDEIVGRLLDQLEKSGQLDNTLFVYTADHGEMLGEHGLWLKNALLENAARVPMLLAGPGLPRGVTVETPVSHVDLVSTLLDFAAAPGAPQLRGHSLRALAHGSPGDHPGFAYSESHSEGNCTGSFMIRKGVWKYLHFTGDDSLLFNLKDDPGELRNLAEAPQFAAKRSELHAILTSLVDPDRVTRRAFEAQEQKLTAIVNRLTKSEFHEELAGRLGAAQAHVLTEKYYRS